MTNYIIRKTIIIVFISVVLVLLTSCGKKDGIEEYDYYRYAYIAETIPIEEIKGDIIGCSNFSDKYFVITENERGFFLYSFGGDLKDIYYNQINIEGCKEIISVSIKNNITMIAQTQDSHTLLLQIDQNGNVLKSMELDNNVNYYNSCVITDDAGNVGVLNEGELVLFNEKLQKERCISSEGYIIGATFSKDKIICCIVDDTVTNGSQQVFIAEIDEKGINKIDKNLYDISGIYGRIMPETYGDLYIRLHDGIYFINDNRKIEKILDYYDSMMIPSDTEKIIINNNGQFVRIVLSDENYEIKKYTHMEEGDVLDKQVIEFGRFIPSDTSSRMIIEFNENNDDYYIRVKDYGFEGGVTQFNLDITMGKCPDIIDFSGYNMLDMYVEKGLIENLDEYIENDKDISMNDFLNTFFEASRIGGNTYFISDSFYISTLVTEKNPYITEYKCTSDEFIKYIKESNNADIFPWQSTRSDLYALLFMQLISAEIDYKKCDFQMNEDKFEKIASLCYELGVERINDGYSIPNFYDQVQAYKEDNALFWTEVTPSEIYFINYIFDNNVCYSGYPEGGSYFVPGECLCICARSGNKEICWEFLKQFLTYDHQSKIALDDGDVIPSRKDCFELQCERMCATTEFIDGKGNVIEPISGELNIKYGVIRNAPLKEEDISHLRELIDNTHKCVRFDEKAMGIIMDEMEAYFCDEHDVDIAYQIIKNRLQTYLSESQ